MEGEGTTISISPEGKLEEKSPPKPPAQAGGAARSVPAATRVVRTLERDMAAAMRDGKGSVVSVALAEQRRRDAKEGTNEGAPPKKRLFLIIGVGAVLIGITAWVGYALATRPTAAEIKATQNIPAPLVFVERRRAIAADNFSQAKLIAAAKASEKNDTLRLDTIEETYFTLTAGDVTEKMTTERFMRTLGTRIPPVLVRSLGPDFMFGVHSFNGNAGFLILKTDFYENAFLGLLNWERDMAQDILPLFGTTFGDDNRYLTLKDFKDMTVKNLDARVLTTTAGDIALIYAFPKKDTILITTSEDTFNEVVNRLNAPKKSQ
ncbi:hypothetical protein KW797_01015 [Candidatus Parcubacteria bacterium]|nr:hypothetical protein [Candidatus Parcubacteria bacterium]